MEERKKTERAKENKPWQARRGHLGAPVSPKQPLHILLIVLSKSDPTQLRQGDSPAEHHFGVAIPH